VNVHPAKHIIKWLNPNEIYQVVYNIIRNNVSFGSKDLIEESNLWETTYSPNVKYNYKEVCNFLPFFNNDDSEDYSLAKNDTFKIIGQLFDTIILIEKDDKIYFIDQHIAHERVLFEKFLQNNDLDNNISTYLSEPILYECNLDKIEFLEHSLNEFIKIGFEFERFGRNAIKLIKVPSYILENAVADILKH